MKSKRLNIVSLEIYQTIDIFKETENKKIELVKSELDQLLYIQKTLYHVRSDVYRELQKLAITGIPRIHEIKQLEDRCIIIESYINAPTLDVYILNHELTHLQVNDIMEQLWQILSVLHQHQLVHRDLKPENIFYDGKQVTLFDFDIARFVQQKQNQDTQLLGSYGYAAPEQYGFGQSDARTDIYALGVLWNVMLTGQHPQQQLYQGYETKLIQKATHMDPKQRYQHVEEMRDDFHHLKCQKWTLVGFRGDTWLVKMIAAFLYLFLMIMLVTTPIDQVLLGSGMDIFYKIMIFGFIMIIVFFAGNYRNLHERCIGYHSSFVVWRLLGIALSCILVLFAWILFFSLLYGIIETLHMFP